MEIEDEDYDRVEAALYADWHRRYAARLNAHPDCRDPDHPGCECCVNDDMDMT